jgi:hypothetical protein
MVALNLDSTSQVNLYRQFLGTKGTVRAAEIFTFADLGRGVNEYQIYENWAVQRGVYGANANRSFYEMRLNEALLTSNPSLVQVVIPDEAFFNKIAYKNVWDQCFPASDKFIDSSLLFKMQNIDNALLLSGVDPIMLSTKRCLVNADDISSAISMLNCQSTKNESENNSP